MIYNMAHPTGIGLVTCSSLVTVLEFVHGDWRLRLFPSVLSFGRGGEADVFEDDDVVVFVEEAEVASVREVQDVVVIGDYVNDVR